MPSAAETGSEDAGRCQQNKRQGNACLKSALSDFLQNPRQYFCSQSPVPGCCGACQGLRARQCQNKLRRSFGTGRQVQAKLHAAAASSRRAEPAGQVVYPPLRADQNSPDRMLRRADYLGSSTSPLAALSVLSSVCTESGQRPCSAWTKSTAAHCASVILRGSGDGREPNFFS